MIHDMLPATDASPADQRPIRDSLASEPSWRHGAAGLLLLLTLPIFAIGAVIAVPVLLLVGLHQMLSAGLERWLESRQHS